MIFYLISLINHIYKTITTLNNLIAHSGVVKKEGGKMVFC